MSFLHTNVTTSKSTYTVAPSSKRKKEHFQVPNDLTGELPKTQHILQVENILVFNFFFF